MILIDGNLLIHAVNQHAPVHSKAKAWVESAMSGTETICLPWTVILAFLRVSTHPGVFQVPMRVERAFEVMDGWLAQPAVAIIEPTAKHGQILRNLLLPLGTGGNLTSDAHLAAIAIEHGAVLCSMDGDFSRFPGLRCRNPLV
jgi:toxin-antitoxin system PIN domain toxin